MPAWPLVTGLPQLRASAKLWILSLHSMRGSANSGRATLVFVARNTLFSMIIFMPVWLFCIPIEGVIAGFDLTDDVAVHVGWALFLYVVFLLPAALGSLFHSALVLVSWWCGARAAPGRSTSVLAPALPLFVIFLGGPEGSALLIERPMATGVATLAYAVATGVAAVGPRRKVAHAAA